MRGFAILGLLGLSSLLVGCGSHENATRTVSRAEFEAAGKSWPLSVPQGEVGCDDDYVSGSLDETDAYWLQVEDKRYGLNGFATEQAGFWDIDPIWRLDEAWNSRMAELLGPEVKAKIRNRISLSDLQTEASKQCSTGPYANGKEPVKETAGFEDAERGLDKETMLARAIAQLEAGYPHVALRVISKNTDADTQRDPETAAVIRRAEAAIAKTDGAASARKTVQGLLAPHAFL